MKLAVKQCYQIGHFFISQKLVKTAKIEKFKYDILSVFQTIWYRCSAPLVLTKWTNLSKTFEKVGLLMLYRNSKT